MTKRPRHPPIKPSRVARLNDPRQRPYAVFPSDFIRWAWLTITFPQLKDNGEAYSAWKARQNNGEREYYKLLYRAQAKHDAYRQSPDEADRALAAEGFWLVECEEDLKRAVAMPWPEYLAERNTKRGRGRPKGSSGEIEFDAMLLRVATALELQGTKHSIAKRLAFFAVGGANHTNIRRLIDRLNAA